jgi:predicted ferric reductase
MQRLYAVRGVAWVSIYVFFILAPLFALLMGSHPPVRDFWTEFSTAIGYAGLAMMGLQFGLTARFRYVTEPWGEDVIYHFHRQISLIAVGLVVAHPIILFIIRPELLALLNSIEAPWRARFAALSTYSLIALVVMALWRANLNIKYETWHLSHIVLALVAVVAGLLHWWGGASISPTPGNGCCGLA